MYSKFLTREKEFIKNMHCHVCLQQLFSLLTTTTADAALQHPKTAHTVKTMTRTTNEGYFAALPSSMNVWFHAVYYTHFL